MQNTTTHIYAKLSKGVPQTMIFTSKPVGNTARRGLAWPGCHADVLKAQEKKSSVDTGKPTHWKLGRLWIYWIIIDLWDHHMLDMWTHYWHNYGVIRMNRLSNKTLNRVGVILHLAMVHYIHN